LAQVQSSDSPASDLDSVVRLGKATADRLRVAILQVLHEESYSVSELCELFAVPQPALSHHLKILHQTGLVAKRREGNSIFYRRASQANLNSCNALQQAMLTTIDQIPLAPATAQRALAIHAARRARSEDFFARYAAEFAGQQARICEPVIYTDTVKDILETTGVIAGQTVSGHALEVGPGDGHLLAWLAGHFAEVTGIDSSPSMLERARHNTQTLDSVTLRHCDFMELTGVDQHGLIIAAMVIHHLASPANFFQQAKRLLQETGTLVVAELCRHDQQWASEVCGDHWLGFEPLELHEWAERAGFHAIDSQFLAQKNGFRIQIHSYQIDKSNSSSNTQTQPQCNGVTT